MKRSEMLKIMYDAIYFHDFDDEVENAHIRVENILTSIEEAGMLPPKSGWLSLDDMNFLYPHEDWKERGYLRKDVNVWEPEE